MMDLTQAIKNSNSGCKKIKFIGDFNRSAKSFMRRNEFCWKNLDATILTPYLTDILEYGAPEDVIDYIISMN
jgi:hypothetical protein